MHFQPLQIVDRHAELGVGLHVHLPGAAEAIEIVDIQRAEVDLQHVEDVGHGDAHRLDGGAVDIQIQPGGVGPEAGEQPLQAGVTFAFVDDLLGHLLQGRQAVVAAVFDHDLEAASRAQAIDRRGAEDVDQPFLDFGLELFLELLRRSRRPTSAPCAR